MTLHQEPRQVWQQCCLYITFFFLSRTIYEFTSRDRQVWQQCVYLRRETGLATVCLPQERTVFPRVFTCVCVLCNSVLVFTSRCLCVFHIVSGDKPCVSACSLCRVFNMTNVREFNIVSVCVVRVFSIVSRGPQKHCVCAV